MRILIPLYWFETSQFTRLTCSLLSSEFLVTDQTGSGSEGAKPSGSLCSVAQNALPQEACL